MPTNTVVGSARAVFTISLVAAATEEVRVDWATKDGTAIGGRDYETNSGTVAFAPGETSKTVEIFVHGRTVDTEDRVFYVLLDPSVNALLADEIGACVIHVDTTGTIPVVAVVIPRGEKGLTGDSAYQIAMNNGFVGTEPEWLDSLRPSPAEIAPLVAPLINAGEMVVVAEGTEGGAHPDVDTIAGFGGRIAHMRRSKIAIAPTLLAGTNIVPLVSFIGDAVDPLHTTGFNLSFVRSGETVELAWSYLHDSEEFRVVGAQAGDIPLALQKDVGIGDVTYSAIEVGQERKQLKTWLEEQIQSTNMLSKSTDILSTATVSVHRFISEITEKPDANDMNTWDWTPAFAAAAALGGTFIVPSGVYTLTSVTMAKDVQWLCRVGAVFKRKAGTDIRQCYWNVGTAMFEIRSQGLRAEFWGGPTFDGNRSQQLGRYEEPSGFSVKVQPPSSPVASPRATELVIQGAKFINGTSGYIPLRGDDANRRYLTRVALISCEFEDTLHGTGKDDPSAITALGYQPDYITALDYVTLVTHDISMRFLQDCPLSFYAACGIRGTYGGAGYPTSGQCSVFMFGRTYTEGLGRDGRKWDNGSDFLTNNGIGAIDIYGNGEELYIENLIGVRNRNVSMRAKGSIRRFGYGAVSLTDCWRGVQVSPSTTGPCEAEISIGTLRTYGGTIPQLELVGTSNTDILPDVQIGMTLHQGVLTNPENLSGQGVVHLRNIRRLGAGRLVVVPTSSPSPGITFNDVEFATLNHASVTGVTAQGITITGTKARLLNLLGLDITGTGLDGISVLSGCTAAVSVGPGAISNVKGNGIICNSTVAKLMCEGVQIADVSTDTGGASRGIYSAAPRSTFIACNVTNAVTQVAGPVGAVRFGLGNSWD